MITQAKCKICRRLREKLFLKGGKCESSKCPMIKKAYAPGQSGKRRRRGGISEYGRELAEKQKLRNWYNLREAQFRKYVKEILKLQKRRGAENASSALIQKLETRLDNVVFRLGFATSRSQAKQLVGHGHFLVNGRRVNIPSYHLRKGDKIKLIEGAQKNPFFQKALISLKNHKAPSWLFLDKKELEGEVKQSPTLEEVSSPVEVSAVFEYYSR